MSVQSLEKIIIEPKIPASACVIWLHGLGDSGDGFAPVVPMLDLPENHGIRFVFPHASEQPVTINQGYVMRSWYDIKSMDLHNRADMDGVLKSEQLVHQLIKEQVAAGIAEQNIVLAGFSQGGVISLFSGLRYPKKLAGILALSCYLPSADTLPEMLSVENSTTAVLQHHGEQDEVVPISAGKVANQLLQQAGYPVAWKSYPMPHSVLPEQLIDIGNWLKIRLLTD
ncbi:carboxylesterase [Colwellia sp. 1_MG-2023]|uniref:alpha/beta hydrolase n=1 Tax=Colwellia sp. 1_MG-2023 TaxID=3062649 RepID=UPI0026E1E3B4|nr:carboxylesterase [Colwellia sp. 1_MG-2023]MDO6444458.1 carboxylesterase [Colwellia sp. 1_MG-2023]